MPSAVARGLERALDRFNAGDQPPPGEADTAGATDGDVDDDGAGDTQTGEVQPR